MLRVMVVDDSEEIREVTSRFVAGCPGIVQVAEASNCDEALARARESRPHLVLLDYRLRGADGAETARRLLAQDPSLKIIGHSSDSQAEPLMRQAGVAGFVIKGDIPSLREEIATLGSAGN